MYVYVHRLGKAVLYDIGANDARGFYTEDRCPSLSLLPFPGLISSAGPSARSHVD